MPMLPNREIEAIPPRRIGSPSLNMSVDMFLALKSRYKPAEYNNVGGLGDNTCLVVHEIKNYHALQGLRCSLAELVLQGGHVVNCTVEVESQPVLRYLCMCSPARSVGYVHEDIILSPLIRFSIEAPTQKSKVSIALRTFKGGCLQLGTYSTY